MERAFSVLSDIHRLDEVLSNASQCNLGRESYKFIRKLYYSNDIYHMTF